MTSSLNTADYVPVAEVACVPRQARVFEQGWQSWSPTGSYAADTTSARPSSDQIQAGCFRADRPLPDAGFQGEGLIVVDPGDGGPVRTWAAADPTGEVPSIRVEARADRLVVSARGRVVERPGEASITAALVRWADDVASAHQTAPGTLGPGWCSWYGFWNRVTEQDIAATLDDIDRLGFDVDIVQLDDGYQAAIGDWLDTRPGFGSVPDVARRIGDTGRRAGIWLTPFFVGAHSALAREHPEWLVRDTPTLHEWGDDVRVLDVTHPEAAEHLTGVLRTLVDYGYTFFKTDYLYAGAHPGLRHQDASPHDAYVEGMRLIRAAIGPDAVLLGCGAPLLPSVGFVDVMRVSPDTARYVMPRHGDLSQPGQLGARVVGRAREVLHGRWWINDPDCLMAGRHVEDREGWADHIARSGGWRCSSDRPVDLDAWGADRTRELLRPSVAGPTVHAEDRAAEMVEEAS